uniref:Sperm microtubule inner protein 1 C-terminal domain-containing protein n=1 Tax=Periophthalmus magnuspinnatus TaxID=409849 RepID=A0A3B3ZTL3_9GOBI
MHSLLTTQSQNSYREQIHKEMMMRLTWKQRYSRFYPTNQTKTSSGSEPGLNKDSIETGPGPLQGGARWDKTRGRSQYLRSRGLMLPEQKFDFPLVSSWEYGWRLARSSVVKSTFYARNGVFNSPSPTDALG